MSAKPLSTLLSAAALMALLSSLEAGEPPSPPAAENASAETKSRGAEHLKAILSEPWASEWRDAALNNLRRVEQRTDVTFRTGLPPVWMATIEGPDSQTGYLMWDATGAGDLVEFAFDADFDIRSENAASLRGLPALQQFAIEETAGKIASGCVPTSAASLVGWWIANGQPAWRGEAGDKDLPAVARRLRAQLTMTRFPDKDGFTEDGMALAGALPAAMAAALNADAAKCKIPVRAGLERFTFQSLKAEITAGRPVLLSCTVRVPHKPELSWGHEVAGIGWASLAGKDFAGISDNFYPVKNPGTVRWIRTDAFSSIITVKPEQQPGKK